MNNYSKEIQEAIEPDKSPERVYVYYINYPKEWKAQYDMLLPDGVTCSECSHCQRCCLIFGQKETAQSCQFYPSKYYPSKVKGGKEI